MKQFSVLLDDRPGELARVCDLMKAVNIRQVTTERVSQAHTKVKLLTADDSSARAALANKFNFTEEELVFVRMLDQPGELGKLARAFGEAKVNISDIYMVDRGVFAVKIDESDREKSINVLKNLAR